MSESDVGRRPIQIVQITFPRCSNVIGTLPCTSAKTGNAKCYNTRSGCSDPDHIRMSPDSHLTPTFTNAQGETVASTAFTSLTADLFAAFDVSFPAVPTGIIWEQGGAVDGVYLGITGSNIVFRAGDGAATPNVNHAYASAAHSLVAGKSGTIYVEINAATDSVEMWFFDAVELTLTSIGTGSASGGFNAGAWASTNDGGVGTQSGTIVTGEDGGTFNGIITSARFYQSHTMPDMTGTYKTDMYFGENILARPSDAILIYPTLASVSTSPVKINMTGKSPTTDPLGNRAQCTIKMVDGKDADLATDPYLIDRTYNPLDHSSLFRKLAVRQKYGKLNARITIYEGYDGEALADMRTRKYLLEKLDQGTTGPVTITGRDLLSKIEPRRAKAPALSPGKLHADIDASVLTLEVAEAVASDYDDAGTIRIGSEVLTYSAVTTNSNNRLDFTLTARGTDGTTAAAHASKDQVQFCLRFSADRIDTILESLIGNYGSVPHQYMNLSGWKTEVDAWLLGYQLSTLITKPVAVGVLVGEIVEQCSTIVWWDERSQLIEMKAAIPISTLPDLWSADNEILADSLNVVERPKERVSQVWIHFAQANPTKALNDKTNYLYGLVNRDPTAEGVTKYKQPQIRVIYSRWLPSAAQAAQTASRLVHRYSEVPLTVTFIADAKDRAKWIGDTLRLDHPALVDVNGINETDRYFYIVSAEEFEPGRKIRYVCEDVTVAGKLSVVMANTAPDFVGDGNDQFNGAWVTTDSGLNLDGTDGTRIS